MVICTASKDSNISNQYPATQKEREKGLLQPAINVANDSLQKRYKIPSWIELININILILRIK